MQPIVKDIKSVAKRDVFEYPVMESSLYESKAKESTKGMRPILFVLGGSRCGCHWCDVKDTCSLNTHPKKCSNPRGRGLPASWPFSRHHRRGTLNARFSSPHRSLAGGGLLCTSKRLGVCETSTGHWEFDRVSQKFKNRIRRFMQR
jgi:hypothetical protein